MGVGKPNNSSMCSMKFRIYRRISSFRLHKLRVSLHKNTLNATCTDHQKQKKVALIKTTFHFCCCGCRTRTCDLQVMSLASYQLLQPAILTVCNYKISFVYSFLNCECKGRYLFLDMQDIRIILLTNRFVLT